MDSYMIICKRANYIGMILTMIVTLMIIKRISEKSVNPIKRFRNERSEEVAVEGNKYIIYGAVIMLSSIVYLITKRAFVLYIPFGIFLLLQIIEMIGYVPMLFEMLKSEEVMRGIPEKLMGIIFKNIIMHLVFYNIFARELVNYIIEKLKTLYILKEKEQIVEILLVGFVMIATYQILKSIVINIYCIIGLLFINSNVVEVEQKEKLMLQKSKEVEDELKNKAIQVDIKIMKRKGIKKMVMGIGYICYHFKAYVLKNRYSLVHTACYIKMHFLKFLKRLLENDLFRRFYNVYRNILIITILMLTNIYLYINYSDNEAIVHFYELLSTVIIIPIVLAKITEQA